MKTFLYLLAAFSFQLSAFSAVSPTMPPTRIIAGDSTVTVVTNGVNSFTLTASGGVGTSNGFATNLSVYSSGTSNRAFRAFGTNGTSQVYVDKDARLYLTDEYPGVNFGLSSTEGFNVHAGNINYVSGGNLIASFNAYLQNGVWLNRSFSSGISWGSGAGVYDTIVVSDSAGVVAQRNGAANPQTNRLYHTYTDANNHQRLALYTSTNSVNIAAETAGTGADNLNVSLLPAGTGVVVIDAPLRLKGYTVATLPAGTQGDTAFVTDAVAPTYLGALVGGGAIVTPVFYNGAAWVSH